MSSDHEAEIRASVGAHADLGPDYDDGVAEGAAGDLVDAVFQAPQAVGEVVGLWRECQTILLAAKGKRARGRG